jgi:hypothetical protein
MQLATTVEEMVSSELLTHKERVHNIFAERCMKSTLGRKILALTVAVIFTISGAAIASAGGCIVLNGVLICIP